MQSEMTKQKLNLVVSMLNGRGDKKSLRLEEAKLKVLLNDPGFEIANELKLVNQGKFSHAIVSIVNKALIMPILTKIFIK